MNGFEIKVIADAGNSDSDIKHDQDIVGADTRDNGLFHKEQDDEHDDRTEEKAEAGLSQISDFLNPKLSRGGIKTEGNGRYDAEQDSNGRVSLAEMEGIGYDEDAEKADDENQGFAPGKPVIYDKVGEDHRKDRIGAD